MKFADDYANLVCIRVLTSIFDIFWFSLITTIYLVSHWLFAVTRMLAKKVVLNFSTVLIHSSLSKSQVFLVH